MADVGPTLIPKDLHVEDAVLLTDAFPTGYQAAEMGDIEEGDTVVVFGAGPVGIFAAKSAWLLGAGRVIVVDHVEYRLEFVKNYAQCEVVNFKDVNDMAVHIKKMTDGLGADICIDCVGCEAAGNAAQTLTGRYMKLQAGAATVLHWAINSVRKGGTVSIVGVYGPTFKCGADRECCQQGPDLAHEPGQREAAPAAADRAHPGWARHSTPDHHAPDPAGGSS